MNFEHLLGTVGFFVVLPSKSVDKQLFVGKR